MHDLYRHLAACDLAIVQGGLATAMELTANRRPFICFPLKHHFEQNFYVHHRLQRYWAGSRMDFVDSPPEAIAEAIAREIGREVDYRPAESDGARRAARIIAERPERTLAAGKRLAARTLAGDRRARSNRNRRSGVRDCPAAIDLGHLESEADRTLGSFH